VDYIFTIDNFYTFTKSKIFADLTSIKTVHKTEQFKYIHLNSFKMDNGMHFSQITDVLVVHNCKQSKGVSVFHHQIFLKCHSTEHTFIYSSQFSANTWSN
jgi:hypothetical protein